MAASHFPPIFLPPPPPPLTIEDAGMSLPKSFLFFQSSDSLAWRDFFERRLAPSIQSRRAPPSLVIAVLSSPRENPRCWCACSIWEEREFTPPMKEDLEGLEIPEVLSRLFDFLLYVAFFRLPPRGNIERNSSVLLEFSPFFPPRETSLFPRKKRELLSGLSAGKVVKRKTPKEFSLPLEETLP